MACNCPLILPPYVACNVLVLSLCGMRDLKTWKYKIMCLDFGNFFLVFRHSHPYLLLIDEICSMMLSLSTFLPETVKTCVLCDSNRPFPVRAT